MVSKYVQYTIFNADLMTMMKKIKEIFPEDKKIASANILADNYINKMGLYKTPSSQFVAQVKKREAPFLARDFDFFEADAKKFPLAAAFNLKDLYSRLTQEQIDGFWNDLHSLYEKGLVLYPK